MVQFIFWAFISIMLLIAMLWFINLCYRDFRKQKDYVDLFFIIFFIGMIIIGVFAWIDIFNQIS